MDWSYIVALASVVTSCLSAIIPPILSHRRWKKERRYTFYDDHRAAAIEKFLSAAAFCLYKQAGQGNGEELYAAFGDVSFYVSEEIRTEMSLFCAAVSNPNMKVSDVVVAYNHIVNGLQTEPPRKLK